MSVYQKGSQRMNFLRHYSHVGGAVSADVETVSRGRQAGTRSAGPINIESLHTYATRITDGVETLRSSYRTAKPYPYLVLDDLFSEDLLNRVVHEMPPPGGANWIRHDDDHIRQFNL